MGHTVGLLIVIGVLWYAGWRVSLRFHPYTYCRRCIGRRGRNPGSTGEAWGNCRFCGGSGRQLRWGARSERR